MRYTIKVLAIFKRVSLFFLSTGFFDTCTNENPAIHLQYADEFREATGF